jgi:hypothetical protein
VSEMDTVQGARSAMNETYHLDRRVNDNKVAVKANSQSDVKLRSSGRNQHRVTQQCAIVATYTGLPDVAP